MTDKPVQEQSEGWGCPARSNRWHYFVEGMSLCKKWWYTGELFNDDVETGEDCKLCERQLAKRTLDGVTK